MLLLMLMLLMLQRHVACGPGFDQLVPGCTVCAPGYYQLYGDCLSCFSRVEQTAAFVCALMFTLGCMGQCAHASRKRQLGSSWLTVAKFVRLSFNE